MPLVLACHGLRASKDSDKYLLLGAKLPAAGLALARFDFRGSGESTGSEEDSTIGTRLEDGRAVLKYLALHRRLNGRIGLLGSSLGGFVALHLAAERRDAPAIVTWNAPANLDDLAAATTGGGPRLGDEFLRELAARVYTEAPAGVPRHLVIQAEADDLVSVEHGANLFARAGEPCDLVLIPGADHRLTDPAHRKEALTRSLEWLLRFLAV